MTNLKELALKHAPVEEPAAPKVDVPPVDNDETPPNLEEAAKAAAEQAPPAEQAKPEGKKPKENGKKDKPKEGGEEKKPEEKLPSDSKADFSDDERSLIEEYESEEAAPAKGDGKKDKKEEKATPTQKELEYDSIVADPFVAAYVEFKKNGGKTDDFLKGLGLSSKEMTTEDYIRAEAVANGLEGEELEDAVAEELANFETLSTLEKRKRMNTYRDSHKGEFDEKIKSFSTTNKEKSEKIQQVINESTQKLQAEVASLQGKKFKGMLIDEPMAAQIMKDAPLYATPILDENGAVLRYDVENGIKAAIAINYLPKLLKETYNLGRTAEAKKYVAERHRPNPDSASTPASAATSNEEEFDVARKGLFKKVGGLGN